MNQSHQPWNFLSILDFKIKNTQPVLLQFNKSEMQDRTYLVSEKLARGNTSSAKHSGTPVPTDRQSEGEKHISRTTAACYAVWDGGGAGFRLSAPSRLPGQPQGFCP